MLRWAVSLACVALCWTVATATPKAPVWPDAYEIQYTVELPYVASLQPVPLKYPVKIWYDGGRSLLRTNFYDGLDETYLTEDATYDIFPRITTRTCLVFNHSTGPTSAGEEGGIVPPLPDIDEQWIYGGTDQLKGKPPAHIWQLSYRVEEKVSTYTFYVSQATGAPLKLHMVGVNLFTGSHYDQYEVDFTYFQARSNENAFKPPELCRAAAEEAAMHPHTQPGPGLSRTAVLQTALSLLPSSLVPKGLPTGHVTAQRLQQGRGMMESMQGLLSLMHSHVMGSEVTQDGSEVTVLENLQYIRAHNMARDNAVRVAQQVPRKAGGSNVAVSTDLPVAPTDLYRMAVNKFVSWSEDRFQGTMLGRLPGQKYKNRRGSGHLGAYQRQLPDDALPTHVDWRGTGADGPVKDQASCGSCWTFATTGAMTGAWFKATGQSLSFSEQQIVDCSWNYDVNGCWGGNTEPALDYIKEVGGIALEANYPYIGQNGYCRDHKIAKAAAFKGYKSIPEGDEKALMEAVALHGPLSIAFDAGDRSFRYYSEGVYYRKDCGTTLDDLNHAVTLVGYGTTWNGTDYWLLRNSWSVAWGADGYFKIARKGNDCGITTDAVLAVVDPEAVERAIGGAAY